MSDHFFVVTDGVGPEVVVHPGEYEVCGRRRCRDAVLRLDEVLLRLRNGQWALVTGEHDPITVPPPLPPVSFTFGDLKLLTPWQAARWLRDHGQPPHPSLRGLSRGGENLLDYLPAGDDPPPDRGEWAARPASVPPCPVLLQGQGNPVLVCGQPTDRPLTPAQYKVLQQLEAIYPEGIDGPDLDAATVPHAGRHVRELRDKHPPLKQVLRLPGTRRGSTRGTGEGGYRIISPPSAPSA